ncbi:MAG: YkgJ family cysteine cluster protein [Agathobaculum desmolans]|uniref:YkgJ family cysteine cluster protein n=1 Tax=Agathobaculum desmolans TaxID=39484 RepID=UPI0038B31DDC
MRVFPCNQCGQCCRHIPDQPQYQMLDRGDGICRYLNLSTNLCTIYPTRPLVCNVDAMYDAYFKTIYTKDKFYKLNQQACEKLKSMGGN